MSVLLAERDSRPFLRPPYARRRGSGRARRIRFATWTVLAVTLVSIVGTVARPTRTAPSRGRHAPVASVASDTGAAISTDFP